MSLRQNDSTESAAEAAQRAKEGVQGETPPKTSSNTFRLARVLFGGLLAFMAVDNFRELEESVAYAESKGAPKAETTVPATSGGLLLGGLGLALWKLPRLSASAVATFLLTSTPLMHDFWAIDDEQEREQELIHFLKNTTMLGATLAFLGIAQDDRKR